MSYEYAVKLVDWYDDETCAMCLKVFTDKYARVKHESTVHTHTSQK
jgi:hypothetical protein